MDKIVIGNWTIEFDRNSLTIITNGNGSYFGLQGADNSAIGVKRDEFDKWGSQRLPVETAMAVSPSNITYKGVPRMNLKGAEQIGYWGGWDIYRHASDFAITLKNNVRGTVHIFKNSAGWITLAPPNPVKYVSPEWEGVPYFTRAIKTVFTATTPIRTLLEAGYKYDFEELMDQSGRSEGDTLTSDGSPID